MRCMIKDHKGNYVTDYSQCGCLLFEWGKKPATFLLQSANDIAKKHNLYIEVVT
jgi:hypothetical protein